MAEPPPDDYDAPPSEELIAALEKMRNLELKLQALAGRAPDAPLPPPATTDELVLRPRRTSWRGGGCSAAGRP